MPSNLKVIQSHNFSGGMTSDLAPEVMEANQYRYMLNCNVLSTSEGNVGILTNVKGTVEIPVPLPDGLNKTIGWCADEEKNNLYFFVYNSDGYHGIYRYNSVDNAVIKVMECITDTGGVDIFRWKERDLILHANIVENNLLYWCVRGEERHPARKIDISKTLDKSESGYGLTILEDWTRAYKRTLPFPPVPEYFTDDTKKYNRLYGYLFKFCARYIYDNGEVSNWSDHSIVSTPDLENFSGEGSIPLRNNGIRVLVDTGGKLVEKVEIAVMSTNKDGGTLPWMSVTVIDKRQESISDNTQYEYNFYNDTSLAPIGDQTKLYRLYSYLPKDPRCQEFVEKAMVYSNFHEGFPIVDVDVDWSVRYEDVFVGDEQDDELNDPQITYYQDGTDYEYMRKFLGMGLGSAYYYIEGRLVIGPDVKNGNIFKVWFFGPEGTNWYYEAKANIGDDSSTIAYKFVEQFKANPKFTDRRSFVGPVQPDGGGGHFFEFKVYPKRGESYLKVSTDKVPVNYATLKNRGQSVNIIKNGSSTRYALVYEDEDGRVSAGYGKSSLTVSIDSVNELGEIKKPVITFNINHRPPIWARYWKIVRTEDLFYGDYISVLIQKTVNNEFDSGDEYTDLVIGSLFTYQKIHPNSTLAYEFKRGDRVRLVRSYESGSWIVPTETVDFEVIDYLPVVEDVINEDVTVDGSSKVKVSGTAEPKNIGSYIRVNGSEREIISIASANEYQLSDVLTTGDPDSTTKVFPSYEIINRRGVLRIKSDPDYPIEADPDNGVFPLVEVYSPSIGNSSTDDDMFFDFGAKFNIIDWGTDSAYHSGNIQDQDISQPAIVEISEGTSYVRNRELPVNNHATDPQVVYSLVEDPSYSDFYVSDMNGNGKRIPLDRGDGEVLFDERARFSNNYIEGTRINGLNDFDNLDRVDYNDKYGAIERLWYEEGKLIVFKHLKDTWTPVYASIITDQGGNPLLAKSDRLLDDKLQYYAWDGGVGDNPESVARLGTNFFHVSPNSMIVARIGGNGVDDISRIYSLDKAVRDHLTSAKKANAHIYGGTDRKNGKYDVIIEKHDNVISDTPISESGWINETEELPDTGVTYSLVSGPSHGAANVSGSVIDYTPDNGYSGPDTMQYEVFVDGVSQGVRNVCLTVVYQEGPKAWRPIDPYCVTEEPSIPCGTSSSYSGGESFPTEEYINLGDDTGTVTLNYDAITVPDKFTVEWDGNIVIDTGYRGDPSNQAALDSALAGRGLPPETIQGAGVGTASFSKTNSSSIAIVRVWAPMAGTAWNFTLTCPE